MNMWWAHAGDGSKSCDLQAHLQSQMSRGEFPPRRAVPAHNVYTGVRCHMSSKDNKSPVILILHNAANMAFKGRLGCLWRKIRVYVRLSCGNSRYNPK